MGDSGLGRGSANLSDVEMVHEECALELYSRQIGGGDFPSDCISCGEILAELRRQNEIIRALLEKDEEFGRRIIRAQQVCAGTREEKDEIALDKATNSSDCVEPLSKDDDDMAMETEETCVEEEDNVAGSESEEQTDVDDRFRQFWQDPPSVQLRRSMFRLNEKSSLIIQRDANNSKEIVIHAQNFGVPPSEKLRAAKEALDRDFQSIELYESNHPTTTFTKLVYLQHNNVLQNFIIINTLKAGIEMLGAFRPEKQLPIRTLSMQFDFEYLDYSLLFKFLSSNGLDFEPGAISILKRNSPTVDNLLKDLQLPYESLVFFEKGYLFSTVKFDATSADEDPELKCAARKSGWEPSALRAIPMWQEFKFTIQDFGPSTPEEREATERALELIDSKDKDWFRTLPTRLKENILLKMKESAERQRLITLLALITVAMSLENVLQPKNPIYNHHLGRLTSYEEATFKLKYEFLCGRILGIKCKGAALNFRCFEEA